MNTLEWLDRLIACDTTSRNSNLELINLIEDWFMRHQIISRLTYNETKQKANLFATLPSETGDIQGGIILSGHTDVVPVDGQEWETNPFEAVLKDGKVYGRGACDMKGFIAVALALIPEFQKLKLSYPIHFAFSYDEEVGCLGAPFLIADLQEMNIKPKVCIVGEPTDMHPVIAHKGIQSFRCKVHGVSAHSSLTHQGCNAIEYAAKFIIFLRQFANELKQGPFDEQFDVPYTTMSTNTIKGGIANNIVPEHCEFTFEFRHLPEVNPQKIQDKIIQFVNTEVLPMMRAEKEIANVQIENTAGVPAFISSNNELINKIRKVAGETEIRKVAYATEAGLFEQAQIPTLVCGPGNIREAHRPNEFVTVEQLEKCEKFLREVMQ